MRSSRHIRVFIIHGWSYNLDRWQAILPELEKRGLEPIMLKVPGLTESSDKVWDMEGYVAWLGEKLSHEAEPIVIGHSNGGRIALSFIQQHPGKIKKLVLIDSAGLSRVTLWRRAKFFVLRILSKLLKPLAAVPGLRKLTYKLIGAQDYFDAPENMKRTMANMLDADARLDLSGISLPTCIIWGSNDGITPLKDAKKMNRLIAGSDLFVIRGARHAPYATNPEEVAEIIARAAKE